MSVSFALFLAMASFSAFAQSTCPSVNFLTARSASLKPSATSHIDVIRQSDGSYTGFEVADAAPYRTLNVTPHFEKQFSPWGVTFSVRWGAASATSNPV